MDRGESGPGLRVIAGTNGTPRPFRVSRCTDRLPDRLFKARLAA